MRIAWRPLLGLAAGLVPVLAGCGPRLAPEPRPFGGFPTLVLTETVQLRAGSLTVTLPQDTRLVADRQWQGVPFYCGVVMVGALPQRMCFERRGEACLSTERMAEPACFRHGVFREEFT